jgi:hypothetical protein
VRTPLTVCEVLDLVGTEAHCPRCAKVTSFCLNRHGERRGRPHRRFSCRDRSGNAVNHTVDEDLLRASLTSQWANLAEKAPELQGRSLGASEEPMIMLADERSGADALISAPDRPPGGPTATPTSQTPPQTGDCCAAQSATGAPPLFGDEASGNQDHPDSQHSGRATETPCAARLASENAVLRREIAEVKLASTEATNENDILRQQIGDLQERLLALEASAAAKIPSVAPRWLEQVMARLICHEHCNGILISKEPLGAVGVNRRVSFSEALAMAAPATAAETVATPTAAAVRQTAAPVNIQSLQARQLSDAARAANFPPIGAAADGGGWTTMVRGKPARAKTSQQPLSGSQGLPPVTPAAGKRLRNERAVRKAARQAARRTEELATEFLRTGTLPQKAGPPLSWIRLSGLPAATPVSLARCILRKKGVKTRHVRDMVVYDSGDLDMLVFTEACPSMRVLLADPTLGTSIKVEPAPAPASMSEPELAALLATLQRHLTAEGTAPSSLPDAMHVTRRWVHERFKEGVLATETRATAARQDQGMSDDPAAEPSSHQ